MSSQSFHSPSRAGRASIITPIVVLGLLAALLPARLPSESAGVSGEACRTLSERPAGSSAGARQLLERCSWLLPEDTVLMEDLATAYETAGAATQAEATYWRALAVDPDFAEARVRLARLLLRRGALEQAREQAEAALRVQPNRQSALDVLNEVSASLHRQTR